MVHVVAAFILYMLSSSSSRISRVLPHVKVTPVHFKGVEAARHSRIMTTDWRPSESILTKDQDTCLLSSVGSSYSKTAIVASQAIQIRAEKKTNLRRAMGTTGKIIGRLWKSS